jgi:hypothetical protein
MRYFPKGLHPNDESEKRFSFTAEKMLGANIDALIESQKSNDKGQSKKFQVQGLRTCRLASSS